MTKKERKKQTNTWKFTFIYNYDILIFKCLIQGRQIKERFTRILSGLKTLPQAEFLSELVHTLKLQVPKELVSSGCTYIHTNQYKKSHLEYETLKLL